MIIIVIEVLSTNAGSTSHVLPPEIEAIVILAGTLWTIVVAPVDIIRNLREHFRTMRKAEKTAVKTIKHHRHITDVHIVQEGTAEAKRIEMIDAEQWTEDSE